MSRPSDHRNGPDITEAVETLDALVAELGRRDDAVHPAWQAVKRELGQAAEPDYHDLPALLRPQAEV